MLKKIPSYLWSIIALFTGIVAGGIWGEKLNFISAFTSLLIDTIVFLVPALILVALAPAIASLIRRGSAGKFASYVIVWFIGTSALAGFFGLVISSLLFELPFSSNLSGASQEVTKLLTDLLKKSSASIPLLAIGISIVIGIVGSRNERLFKLLTRIEEGMNASGKVIGKVMVPLILLFGINIGESFGINTGLSNYLILTAYTFTLCFIWWLFYVFFILKLFAKTKVGRVVKEYFIPTSIFAASTCSSLATLPVNLAEIKGIGVKKEIADFVVPFGAVINLNASTLVYIAYAPFILTYLMGIPVSWTLLMLLWPAVVIFTIASPGLPAGMGTALWSGTLLSMMLNMQEPMNKEFLAMWIALSSGLPDMIRTATNCTIDGFTAIVFDKFSSKFFNSKSNSHEPG